MSECPNLTVKTNKHDVQALIDTGSEVTTVTQTWVAKHIGAVALQSSHLKLRAVNGAEVPYSGIVIVDLQLSDNRFPDVQVLVVEESVDPTMCGRKRRVPMLIGMHVISLWWTATPDDVPTALRTSIQEVRHSQSVCMQGIAKTAVQT